jgi:hypothetical protein
LRKKKGRRGEDRATNVSRDLKPVVYRRVDKKNFVNMVVMWIYLKVVLLREDALLSSYLRLLRLAATREALIELVARVRRFHGSARESFRRRSVNSYVNPAKRRVAVPWWLRRHF